MKITLRIDKEEFDIAAFMVALRSAIEQEGRNAGKAFAEAALPRIPVRTGFVAGAFGTLVALVGSTAPLNPIITQVWSTLGQSEYYYPGGGSKVLKTSTSGMQYATPPNEIFRWEGNTYMFNFNVDISYFKINDMTQGNAPTAPWGAFEAGEAAYRKYLEENLEKKLPKPNDFIRIKSESV